jgi:phosphate transport system substrate-binding protein
LCLLVTACPGSKREGAAPRIAIKGSNTFGETLGPRLITEYQKAHPKVKIDLENRGTGTGFYALFAGTSDIAAASRGMITNELVLAEIRGIQLNDYVIGSYGVAVIAGRNCHLASFSLKQVRDIFTGAVHNWKDLGGLDGPIHLFVRDPVSGTALGFQELAMENKPYATNVTLLPTYEAIVQAVARDEWSIGYVSLQLAALPNVKALSVGGVRPSLDAVKCGNYPYARTLHLFTNKAKETSEAHDFIQFVLSSAGQQIVDGAGFVPHP